MQLATWQALCNKGKVHETADTPKAKDWQREFAKLTEAELARGLDRVSGFTGFFDISAFVNLCTGIDYGELGLPEPERAYQEACRNAATFQTANWSHAAVYHAAIDTGIYELKHARYQGPEHKEFRHNYHQRVHQHMGGVLPPIPEPELIPQKLKPVYTHEDRLRDREKFRQERARLGI